MTYNAKEALEAKSSGLPEDSILDGVITKIDDGKIKDFVDEQYHSKFEGGVDKPAINVELEIKNPENDEIVKTHQMFTYIEENGKTLYSSKSNLGKYKVKYNKLPEPGDHIKVLTDGKGIAKIKIE